MRAGHRRPSRQRRQPCGDEPDAATAAAHAASSSPSPPPATTTATLAAATAAAEAGDVNAWLDALRDLVSTAGEAGAMAGLVHAAVGRRVEVEVAAVPALQRPPPLAAAPQQLPSPRNAWSLSSSSDEGSPFRVGQRGGASTASDDGAWTRSSDSDDDDRRARGHAQPPPALAAAVAAGVAGGYAAGPAAPILFGSWGPGEVLDGGGGGTKADAAKDAATTPAGDVCTATSTGPAVAVHASSGATVALAPPLPPSPTPVVAAPAGTPAHEEAAPLSPTALTADAVSAFASAVLSASPTAPPPVHLLPPSLPASLAAALADAAREAAGLEGDIVRPATGRRTGAVLVAASAARVARWATAPDSLDAMLAEDAADDSVEWQRAAREAAAAAAEHC